MSRGVARCHSFVKKMSIHDGRTAYATGHRGVDFSHSMEDS